jgi:hypothetical protein
VAPGSLTLSLLACRKERRVKKQLNCAILVIAGLACNALPAFPPQNAQESQKSAQRAA